MLEIILSKLEICNQRKWRAVGKEWAGAGEWEDVIMVMGEEENKYPRMEQTVLGKVKVALI